MLKLVRSLFVALRVLNLVFGTGFFVLLALSFAFATAFAAHLHAKYGTGMDVVAVLAGVRWVLVVGMVCVAPVQVLLTALIRMLRTVEAGDPFVAANARRLHTIGWALLAVQLLDGVFGLVIHSLARTGADIASGWSPALAGWLAVVLVFVLARVFGHGTALRDELEMTV